jgi:hypothetical protein
VARPVRSFQVIGVLILIVGAVAGTSLGVGRSHHNADTVDLLGIGSATPSPAGDPTAAAAAKARAKADAAAADASATAKRANDVVQRDQAASRSGTRSQYPAPSSCKEYTGNRAIGCALLLDAGFGLDQMPCLDHMWTKESNWNPKSTNKSSGAYGIPQALPADKLAAYGADWQTNPVPQIKWGLAYIKNRYSTPCGAWTFWQAHNWY